MMMIRSMVNFAQTTCVCHGQTFAALLSLFELIRLKNCMLTVKLKRLNIQELCSLS